MFKVRLKNKIKIKNKKQQRFSVLIPADQSNVCGHLSCPPLIILAAGPPRCHFGSKALRICHASTWTGVRRGRREKQQTNRQTDREWKKLKPNKCLTNADNKLSKFCAYYPNSIKKKNTQSCKKNWKLHLYIFVFAWQGVRCWTQPPFSSFQPPSPEHGQLSSVPCAQRDALALCALRVLVIPCTNCKWVRVGIFVFVFVTGRIYAEVIESYPSAWLSRRTYLLSLSYFNLQRSSFDCIVFTKSIIIDISFRVF